MQQVPPGAPRAAARGEQKLRVRFDESLGSRKSESLTSKPTSEGESRSDPQPPDPVEKGVTGVALEVDASASAAAAGSGANVQHPRQPGDSGETSSNVSDRNAPRTGSDSHEGSFDGGGRDDARHLASSSTRFSSAYSRNGESSSGGGENGENAAAAATQRHGRLLSGGLLVIATVIAVTAGVVTGLIVYNSSVSSLRHAAAQRGTSIISGASVSINELQERLVMNVNQIALFIRTFDAMPQNVDAAVRGMNASIFAAWSSRIHVRGELYSFAARLLFPPVLDVQWNAPNFLPNFTAVASWAVYSDTLRNGSSVYYYAQPEPTGRFAEAMIMEPQPPYGQLAITRFAYSYDALGYSGANSNSTVFTRGEWLPPRLWETEDGVAYYYYSYQRVFRHSGVAFIAVAHSTVSRWYEILAALMPTSESEFLLLTDGLGSRVLGFSDEPVGDRRLLNCSTQFNETGSGIGGPVRCGDLSAFNHPHWFVRGLFAAQGDFVLEEGRGATSEGRWLNVRGRAFLVVTKEIFNVDQLRIIATYAVEEHVALQSIPQRVTMTVVASIIIVVVATVFLALVGFVMMRRTHRTVELVAQLAFHISRYDIEGAEEVLGSDASSGSDNALRREFVLILENLKGYRAFLPAALMHPDPLSTPNDVNSEGWTDTPRSDADGAAAAAALGQAGLSGETLRANPLAAEKPAPGGSMDNADSKKRRLDDGSSSGDSSSDSNDGGDGAEGATTRPQSPLSQRRPPAPTLLTAEKLKQLGTTRQRAVFSETRLRTSAALRPVRGTVLVVDIGEVNHKRASAASAAINTFFRIVIEGVKNYGGVIDSLQACSIVVTFNFHMPSVKHEEMACRCALKLLGELRAAAHDSGLEHCSVIAIASGFNLVGTCGTASHKSRIIAGEAIDLARKMVTLQRRIGCAIAVTEQIALVTSFATAAVDVIAPAWVARKRIRHATIFELRPRLRADDDVAQLLNSAVGLLREKKFDDASALLSAFVGANGSDFHVKRLHGLCERNAARLREGGLVREEVAWEPLEGAQFLEEMLHSSSGSSGGGGKLLWGSNSKADTEAETEVQQLQRARRELRSAAKAREQVLTLQEEDNGTALFSIFLPQAEAPPSADGRNGQDKEVASAPDDEPPRCFCDVAGDGWQRSSELLGRGQFGNVYMAVADSGTLCALKSFHLTDRVDPDVLVKETEVLQRLRHEHIVTYVSCAVTESHFMILLEHMPGGTLRRLIQGVGALPRRAIVRYLADILAGLQFLHESTFAHLDLKCDNILLAADGTCKLADFGTAKLLTMESLSMMVRGTARYMAPEAALGQWGTPADIFSLGIVLVEMYTGRNPWSHVKLDDNTFLMRLSRDPTMVPAIPEDMEPGLRAMACECLRRDPQARPSAAQLLQRIQLLH